MQFYAAIHRTVHKKMSGFTLESLVEQVDVTKAYLSQIGNRCKPDAHVLLRQISIDLNASIDNLVKWSKEQQ